MTSANVNTVLSPWVEGEKIPDERVRQIFCPPPFVPTTFYRSSLIIGARGVGKTTLFRYLKETHRGLAVHISLATEFASLTKQTGFGPLALEYPQTLEPLFVGKATTLLALSLVERLCRKNIVAPADILAECLPRDLRSVPDVVDVQWCGKTRTVVARTPLEKFEELSQSRPLPTLASALGMASLGERGPLLLLLDRADMIPPPFLGPVIELLDQSSNYVALVAMRPGHAGRVIVDAAQGAVPGDHYGVVHLGTTPYSVEWGLFVLAAVKAQLGETAVACVPSDIRDGMIAFSRDSLRTALELFARCHATPGGELMEELQFALDDLKENQLVAAQRTLQRHHQDFRKLVNGLRAEAIEGHGRISGPVLLLIEETPPKSLFDRSARLDRFVDAALRSGALCMPNGQRWVPGLEPRELEVPPLLLWDKGDSLWTQARAKQVSIRRSESAVLRVSAGAPQPPSIFIAYRMTFEESIKFRQALEDALASHPDLAQLAVTDGRVPHGVKWADVIRDRIKKSKVVVGDVTGMRPDVVFELGFAFGLRKVVIPVVSNPDARSGLPAWLGATQTGDYATESGVLGIVSSIAALLSDPEFSRVPRPPDPVPGLAVWWRVLDWNNRARQEFEIAVRREGLNALILDEGTPDDILIRRATSASLLIVSLDGSECDGLAHYICGGVVSRPQAGYGRLLSREVLLLEPPNVKKGGLVADSLRRCQETALAVGIDEVREETLKYCQRYRRWLGSRKPQRG
ncbi:MAG: hypothetical protein ACE5JU_16755 [Candidatus Binatia bacterium]